MSQSMAPEITERNIKVPGLLLRSAEEDKPAIRLRELESENLRLQQLVAELLIKNHQLRRQAE